MKVSAVSHKHLCFLKIQNMNKGTHWHPWTSSQLKQLGQKRKTESLSTKHSGRICNWLCPYASAKLVVKSNYLKVFQTKFKMMVINYAENNVNPTFLSHNTSLFKYYIAIIIITSM